MTIEIWLAFVVASSALLIIPGPTILTVVSYSLSHGRQANIPLIAAVGLGDAVAVSLSLMGLGALLATSAFWFTVVKWVGGLYLIYLGLGLLRSGMASISLPAAGRPKSWHKLFVNTFLVTALNPKGIVFFVAFLPQFIDAGGNVVRQMWILGATFVVLGVFNSALYAVFADAVREYLATAKAQRRFSIAGGSLLSIAGVWALLAKRPA